MQTLDTWQIDAVTTLRYISDFTLRLIGARDIVVDNTGALAFFYRAAGRVQIRQTEAAAYSVEVGHVERHTHEWVIDSSQHGVTAEDLRRVLQEMT